MTESIYFVIGPPCAGKSTFIKEHFPSAEVVDLYDFQFDFMTIRDVVKSYEDAEKALLEAIGKPVIVFEHTLLKAIRRKRYIDAIRKLSNAPIYCYVIKPDIDEYLKRSAPNMTPEYAKAHYELLEIPTKDEGFERVFLIE